METSIFGAFEKFDFENDKTYKNGLLSINQEDSLKTRHFYFTKTVGSFDLEAYILFKSKPKQPEPKKDLTFSEIMAMVKAGKEIPGVKTIPDVQLGLGKSSTSTLNLPKKPWES